jgi:hypothetical protein
VRHSHSVGQFAERDAVAPPGGAARGSASRNGLQVS